MTTFVPITQFSMPEDFPFTLEVFDASGKHTSHKVPNKFNLPDLRNAVAVRYVPERRELRLVRNFIHNRPSVKSTAYNNRLLGDFAAWLLNNGELADRDKVDINPSNSLELIMSQKFNLSEHEKQYVHNWFNNPSRYLTAGPAAKKVNNGILAVEELGYGRRVVTPCGHTLAYTKCQEIWSYICDPDGFQYIDKTVSAREFRGRNRTSNSRYNLSVTSRGVEIGCQFIPMSAIVELANREGWGGSLNIRFT